MKNIRMYIFGAVIWDEKYVMKIFAINYVKSERSREREKSYCSFTVNKWEAKSYQATCFRKSKTSFLSSVSDGKIKGAVPALEVRY